jgi:predicted RNase H-like HicB family nuclease
MPPSTESAAPLHVALCLFQTRQTEGQTTPVTMTTATPQRLTAILHREDEVYVAECPEVGSASQGDTIEEALANLREATELYLEECPQPALAPRLLTTFAVNVA